MERFFIYPIFADLDLLLLGLTVGAALNFVLAVRGEGASRGLHSFFEQEQPLFGRWALKKRLAAGQWMFLAAAVLQQYQAFFANSLVREVVPAYHEVESAILDWLICFLLLCKILLASRYSGLQLAVGWPAFFIMRWVFVNNHNLWVGTAVLFLMAAKDVPLRRALTACLAVGAASVAAVMALSIPGIIPSVVEADAARPRNSFGYGWYNLLGAYLLGLGVMYVYWRRVERLKWYDFALLALAAWFCDWGPDSRGASVGFVLLVAACLVGRFAPAVFSPKPLRALLAAAPVLAFALSYWMHWAYSPDNALLAKLDSLFTGRLRLGHEAIENLPVKIAGMLDLQGAIIDNVYLSWWFSGGPVASALVWGGFAVLLWMLLKAGHISEGIGLLVFLAHGFMEPHVTWPCVNVAIWLLWAVVWPAPGRACPSFAPPNVQKERTL